MKKYQYQIVRYIHDIVTGEFVNVGVIIFAPESNYLSSKLTSKYGRITAFFPQLDGQKLIEVLGHFEKSIEKCSQRLLSNSFINNLSIEEITSKIIHVDDSAIQCSSVQYGIDLNLDYALEDLYSRFIDKYVAYNSSATKDDKFVWQQIYKQYFDNRGITEKLSSHEIKTEHDSIKFEKSWKNGSYHCFQALSFDFKQIDSLKNKVYKWSGILKELEKSEENLNLYFLTSGSEKFPQLKDFIEDSLQFNTKTLTVRIVDENEAEQFADEVQAKMEESET